MKRIITIISTIFMLAVPAFAQEGATAADAPTALPAPEKVFTVKFGYAAVYYSASDGYFLKMHTDSRKDGQDTYNTLYLGKTASACLESVDKMSAILSGDKLYAETRQKGTVVMFKREVNIVGYRQLAIRQNGNIGDSRLDERQLTKIRSFFTERAAQEAADLLRMKALQEEEAQKAKEGD